MSKQSKIREDKTCENCNYVVSERFCGHCGQENVVLDKSFIHLFKHFFEDITHYDNAFWKTIKFLFLRPGFLPNEYLNGKRKSYLPPVRLYIFASFITFFILSLLPNGHQEKSNNHTTNKVKTEGSIIEFERENSLKKLDSIQKFGKENEKLNPINYWFNRKFYSKLEEIPEAEFNEKFLEAFSHNLPKGIFIYMPIFSLMLWLFQNKKKWYYFDHAIFTIYYFSFLLLSLLFYNCINSIFYLLPENIFLKIINYIISLITISYIILYYFIANKKFYKEKTFTIIIKGIFLVFINLFFLVLTLLLIAFYSILNLH